MELKGKKIVFLGDSITEGVGTSSQEHTFWKVFERRTGAECFGYGIGGTRIAMQHVVPSENPAWDLYFGSRVEEMRPDADVVVVFGGTNDFGHGDAPLGEMSDRDEETFFGALHSLFLKLINKYPEAQLVVMTPLHRASESDTRFSERGLRRVGSLETYVNAISQVAAFYGIPVLDLFRTSGLQPLVPVLKEKYMPDGLHPNDAGHEKIAEKLIGFMGTI